MLIAFIKNWAAMCTLAFCPSLCADITINIDGEEFYSDTNGFSGIRPEHVPANITVNVNGEAYQPKVKKGVKSAARSKTVSYSRLHAVRASNSKNKKQFEPLIANTAVRHQVDPRLLHAVIQAESAYNPVAVSAAGAVGLMQLMPATAARFGVTDRYDPMQNIEGGTRYLKHLLRLFNSDLQLAVAAYNAGENAVIRYHNRIPPYAETRHYVTEVLSLHQDPDIVFNAARRRSGFGSIPVLEWDAHY